MEVVQSSQAAAFGVPRVVYGRPQVSADDNNRLSYALVVGLHRNGITPPAAPA